MKKNNLLKSIGFVVALIVYAAIIHCFIIHSASNENTATWYSFLGDFSGGIATLLGVAITLCGSRKETDKQLAEQRREFDEQLSEERNKFREEHRILVSPYIVTDFQYITKLDLISDANAHTIDVENNEIKTVYNGISTSRRKFIANHLGNEVDEYAFIKYTIRNIGSGSAISMVLRINSRNFKFALAVDDEINLYFFIHKEDQKPHSLNFHYDYWDQLQIGHYEFSEGLRYEFNESDSATSFIDKEWQHKSNAGSKITE